MNDITLLVSYKFKKNNGFRAGLELVRRGVYRIVDRKKHLFWEWIAIKSIK